MNVRKCYVLQCTSNTPEYKGYCQVYEDAADAAEAARVAQAIMLAELRRRGKSALKTRPAVDTWAVYENSGDWTWIQWVVYEAEAIGRLQEATDERFNQD